MIRFFVALFAGLVFMPIANAQSPYGGIGAMDCATYERQMASARRGDREVERRNALRNSDERDRMIESDSDPQRTYSYTQRAYDRLEFGDLPQNVSSLNMLMEYWGDGFAVGYNFNGPSRGGFVDSSQMRNFGQREIQEVCDRSLQHTVFDAHLAYVDRLPRVAERPSLSFESRMMLCAHYESILGDFEMRYAAESWVLGFLSGQNASSLNTLGLYRNIGGLRNGDYIGSIQSYCQQDPGGHISQGVVNYIGGLPMIMGE